MTLKEIKVGETYNLRVKVVKNDFGDTGEIATVTVDENGQEIDGDIAYYTEADAASFSAITPENGTKNSEPAPKYAPCRLFKKGDKVRVVARDGRDFKDYDPYTNIQKSEIYTILENENEVIDGGCVDIIIGKGNVEHEIPFYFLELVTPVEELEPYYVEDVGNAWCVRKPESSDMYSTQAWFSKERHPHAKEAAEAECARLNAEYRKEVEK